MQDEKTKYVTIELSKKQVDMTHPHHSEKNGKEYLRVFAPGGGVYFYPAESLKVKADNQERVFFQRPEGTEIQVQYSQRKAGVPDTAPNSEKYENLTRTIKIEDLREMYEQERREFAERGDFVNMTVPSTWGTHFISDGDEYVSVSVPIPTQENPQGEYFSFIMKAEHFRDSTKEQGMSYFGFPKKKSDDENADYMISLKARRLQDDGSYEDVYNEIPSIQLKEYVEAAKERSDVRDLFVGVEISEKLTREFDSNAGKSLVAVLVPVYDEQEKKDIFYEIVVPKERVKASKNDGSVRLSLFKNGPDGEAYNFNAKRSVRVGENQYEDVTKKMTSTEVVQYFNTSSQRYRESNQSNASSHSLADELDESHAALQQNIQDTLPHRHRGR